MIREAAEKTGENVGDGTSTSAILAHSIFSEGLRNIAAGASGVDLKRGLDRGLQVAVTAIKAISQPVVGDNVLAQVATVSAHNDSVLGELVADAMRESARRASSRSRKRRAPRQVWKLWKGCSLIADFCHPTLSRIPKGWRLYWRIP